MRKGFTLLEMMVVIGIIALLTSVVVIRSGNSVGNNMKKDVNRLAARMRYLYNKAAMERLYIRIAFDLDAKSYRVEATADPFLVERETGKIKDNTAKKEKKETPPPTNEAQAQTQAQAGGADKSGAKTAGVEALKAPVATFTPLESSLVKPTNLSKGISFKDIQVEHRKTPVDAGEEYIYFFPNGYVEQAVINFKDEKDELHYAIVTSPISGKVKIEKDYVKMGQ